MTALDFIRLSLKLCAATGIGQSPDAEDVSDSFTIFKAMLAQWNRKRWLIPNEVDSSIVSTGAPSYTIGPTGDIDIRRPDHIMSAYVRLLPSLPHNTVDVPLGIITAPEEYASIVAKNIVGFPSVVHLEATYPLAKLHLYPVASSGMFEIHVLTKGVVQVPTTLTEEMVVPEEYVDPILWNTAARLRPLFGAGPDATIIQLAKMGLNTIRAANVAVPHMNMPPGIGRWSSSRYAGHGLPNWASLG